MKKPKKAPKNTKNRKSEVKKKNNRPEKILREKQMFKKSILKREDKDDHRKMQKHNNNLPQDGKQNKNRNITKNEIKKYFDVLPVITIVLNTKGDIRLINPKGCELLGYKEEEIIGKNWFDVFISTESREKIFKVFKKAITGKISQIEYYENSILCKDKTEKLIAWRNTEIKNESGEITEIISSGIDITERRKTEEDLRLWQERYEIIADMSGQVIYNYEIDSGKISWSGKVEDVIGYTKEEMGDINDWTEKIHPDDRKEALRLLEIAERNVGIYDVEYRFLNKSGSYEIMLDKGIFLPDAGGKAVNMVGTMQDITEKKGFENALIKSEKKYRTLFENVTSAFALHEIISDNNGKPVDFRFLEVNPEFESLLKVSAKDLIGKTVKQKLPVFDKFFIDVFGKVALTGKETSFERYIPELDKYFIFHVFSPKKNQFALLISDFTEKIKQQKELKEKEEILRVFINSADDPMFMIDREGITVYANKALADNFNITLEELTGKNVYSFLPAEIARKRKKYNDSVFKTGKTLRYEDERNGRYFNNIVYPVFDGEGKVNNVAIITSDITEKKQAELMLFENQNRLAETEKFSLVMVTYSDLNSKWLKVPPSLCNFLGYSEEELLKSDFRDITHPEDIETEMKECRKLINGEKKSFELEKRYIKKDGSPVWVYINCSIVLDRKNKPLNFITYIKDITDRKNAENALKKNEELLGKIANTATDAIVLIDNEGKILFWNPAAEKMFGYKTDEIKGKEFHKVFAPSEFIGDYLRGFGNFRLTGKGIVVDRTLEFTAQRKDGIRFPIEVSTSALMIDGKWHATGFIRDITQRKKSEEIIKSSLKEKEILLKEVHHRVKNNLQVISSLLSIQAEKIGNKDLKSAFYESQHRIKSIAKVHENLYQAKNISSVDANEYITSLTADLFRTYGEFTRNITLAIDITNITLNIDYAVPCGLIINEAVMNSLKYAFPGNITEEKKCEIFIKMNFTDDESIELVVGDNGIGLHEKSMAESKEKLGINLIKILSTSQLKGNLVMETSGGTTYTIRFKISDRTES